MTIHRAILIAFVLLAFSVVAAAQKPRVIKPVVETAADVTPATASPAYAELLLRRTDLQSELESLLIDYTEEYPRVREIRHVLTLADREGGRLLKVSDTQRLTLALGRLVVRKIELETDLWKLLSIYKDEHPDVKRAKRKIEIYENAIAEILK